MGSLRALTASFLLAFLAATVLTGYATFTASHRAVVALVDRRIAAIGDAVTEDIRPGDASAIAARIASLSRRRDTGDVGFALTDRRGRRLAGNVALSRHIPDGLSTLSTRDAIPGLSAGRALVRDVGGGYRLAIVAETEPIDGYAALRTRNYVLGFGSITLVVLGGTVLLGRWFVGGLARSVRRLRRSSPVTWRDVSRLPRAVALSTGRRRPSIGCSIASPHSWTICATSAATLPTTCAHLWPD